MIRSTKTKGSNRNMLTLDTPASCTCSRGCLRFPIPPVKDYVTICCKESSCVANCRSLTYKSNVGIDTAKHSLHLFIPCLHTLQQSFPSVSDSTGPLCSLHFQAVARSYLVGGPSLLGWRPSLLGWRPSLVGWRPLLLVARTNQLR